MKQALLIAGPLVLDDISNEQGLIGGGGGYAAMAAAALVPTQLWARGGTGFDDRLKTILSQRRIDLAGISWDGASPRFKAGTFTSNGAILGALAPTSAELLGAVLLVDLAGPELDRAIAAVRALPGHETRPLIIALRHGADLASEERAAMDADILILSAGPDPLTRSATLQALGAKCVCWCQGIFGGLVTYQQKATTWPALPLEMLEATGMRASFAGILAASCAQGGKADFSTIKRGLAMASAVASITGQGIGPRKLLSGDRKTFEERFNRLRRTHKF